MTDTRKFKRALVSLKVRFKSATVDEFIEQYSSDISRGGIFIKSKSPMPIGTLLKFEFQLQDESRLIHGVGRVVWVREAGVDHPEDEPPGMGIKFIKMDLESRAMVDTIVSLRGAAAGAFEEGSNPAIQPAPPETPFFPSTTPIQEMPKPEDRTQVRHASEFLASALSKAGDRAAAEAEASAAEARQRSEDLQREYARRDPRARLRSGEVPVVDVPASAGPEFDVGDETIEGTPQAAASAFVASSASAPRAPAAPSLASDPLRGLEGSVPLTSSAAHEKAVARAPEPAAPMPSSFDPAPAASARGATLRFGTDEATQIVRSSRPPKLEKGGRRKGGALAWVGALGALAFVIAMAAWYRSQPNKPAAHPTVGKQALQESPPPSPSESENAEAPAQGGDTTPATAKGALTDQKVVVSVSSKPKGATVKLDGKEQGSTPVKLLVEVGREVKVAVKADGYAEEVQTFRANGSSPSLRFNLQPLPYILEVRTLPPVAIASVGESNFTTPGELKLGVLLKAPVDLVVRKAKHHRISQRIEPTLFTEQEGAMRYRMLLKLKRREPGSRDEEEGETPVAKRESEASKAPVAKKEGATESAAPKPAEVESAAPADKEKASEKAAPSAPATKANEKAPPSAPAAKAPTTGGGAPPGSPPSE